MAFNATMIREKCVIQDPSLGKQGSRILSNRLVVPVEKDNLVVRGQNMHSVARMAARLYNRGHSWGPLSTQKIDWKQLWQGIEDGAHMTNPSNWIAVYVNGQKLFSSGEHHPFLDLIEQQVARSDSNYDLNVMLAAETFRAAGHPSMNIDHSTNVALILSIADGQGRCGLIYRHPRRTTTFSFSVAPGAREIEREVAGILESSSDFLESIQICYAIAAESVKGIDQDFKKEAELKRRLNELRNAIDGFEEGVTVTYRPERPDMNRFLQEAQLLLTKKGRA